MDRLEQLMEAHFDGSLTASELAELSRGLQENPARGMEFAELFQQGRALETLHHQEARTAVEAIMAELRKGEDSFLRGVMDGIADEGSARRPKQPPGLRGMLGRVSFRGWALGASLAALVIGCSWVLVPSVGKARISRVDGGDSQVHHGLQSVAVVEGMEIEPGDVIETGLRGGAVVSFDGEQTLLEVKRASRVEIKSWGRGKRLNLSQGTIEATVARQKAFRPLIITTPNASARVIGTHFILTATTERTELQVMEGIVRLADANPNRASPVDVGAGEWAVVAPATELAALPRTGSILREYWTNMAAATSLRFLYTISNFPNPPSGSEFLDQFETPANWGDNFNERLRGYLIPAQTGDYSFWIAGNDSAELWFSRDSNPENKVQVAFTKGSARGAWDQSPGQHSATLHLTAGRLYYIEAVRSCGVGDDHLAVAWQGPAGKREVIPGRYLAPFKSGAKNQIP